MVKFIESELVLLKKEIDEMWTLVYNQLDRAGDAVLTLDRELEKPGTGLRPMDPRRQLRHLPPPEILQQNLRQTRTVHPIRHLRSHDENHADNDGKEKIIYNKNPPQNH